MTPKEAAMTLSRAAAQALLNERDRLQCFEANKVLQEFFQEHELSELEKRPSPLRDLAQNIEGQGLGTTRQHVPQSEQNIAKVTGEARQGSKASRGR